VVASGSVPLLVAVPPFRALGGARRSLHDLSADGHSASRRRCANGGGNNRGPQESFSIDSRHRDAMAKRIRKEHEMKGLVLTIGAVIAALTLTFGLSIASASSRSAAAGTKVGTASTSLGQILVDGRGRTLYLFAKDKSGKSACSGICASYWPPLIASGKPHAVTGAKASLLGTIRRADGRRQVTYRHHPLYRFSGDTQKGLTTGQGLGDFGGKWWVVSPAGSKNTTASSTPNPGY
jgi:predicted lipoprotein with Yx(FWY)xxD motif